MPWRMVWPAARNSSLSVRPAGSAYHIVLFGNAWTCSCKRGFAQVTLPLNPENVVMVEHAPDGREWIAPAPVNAAHRPARRLAVRRDGLVKIGINQALARCEQALILLIHPGIAQGAAFLGDKLPADAGAIGPGHLDL